MPLRFCPNLNFMFQETPNLLERYVLAQKAGFQGVECASPYSHPVEDVVRAKSLSGMDQILINVATGRQELGELGFAALPGKEQQFVESLNLSIEYAKKLNCQRIHIMSGIVPDPSNEHHILYENNIKKAAAMLEKENITGVIEPINNWSVPGYYMNDYDRAVDLITRISSPSMKLQLDVFHLQHLKGNLTHNIKKLFPHVGHVQIAQVPGRNEPDTPGEINYSYIFSILETLGYDGWIGLEYKPLNSTEQGLKWMKEYI